MKKIFAPFLFLTFCVASIAQQNITRKHALVIHGGAGTILKSSMTPEKEKAYKAALELALKTGDSILANGGKAVDAVVAAIKAGNGSATLTTIQGGKLVGSIDGKNVILTDEKGNKSTITAVDIASSNGVIHVIDSVVLPK